MSGVSTCCSHTSVNCLLLVTSGNSRYVGATSSPPGISTKVIFLPFFSNIHSQLLVGYRKDFFFLFNRLMFWSFQWVSSSYNFLLVFMFHTDNSVVIPNHRSDHAALRKLWRLPSPPSFPPRPGILSNEVLCLAINPCILFPFPLSPNMPTLTESLPSTLAFLRSKSS